ncbi:MAG: glycine cleavage system aminomethyltransferase GcvT [Pseudomonadota bacterium]
MGKKTALAAFHAAQGARMVDFAGWEMPVQYAGVIAEHAAARQGAALFDVSHMGQVELRGADPAAALERLVPGGITSLAAGAARYTVLTNDAGGVIDDLIVTHGHDHLFLVVNAARAAEDLAHLRAGLDGVEIVERTDLALLAVQGPAAEAAVAGLLPGAAALRFMHSAVLDWGGVSVRTSRLGYTGEDGFELSLPAARAEDLAAALAAAGVVPAGLGARDSLRLEAGLCLYGQDLDEDTSPAEAGLGWAIPKRRRAAGDFPGAARIVRELAEGPTRRLVGLRPAGRAPARADTPVQAGGAAAGTVTSGGFGPTLDGPISMGYVAVAQAAPGTAVDLIVRGKPLPAQVTALPFVPHRYRR